MATERIDVVVTEAGAREVSRRIEDVGRAAAQASGPLLAMQRLLASYISFEGIRRLMQLADQYTEMENRIRVLDGTTQHYSVTLRRLYNISQETRSSLRDNVLLFQRMGLAQRELGATTEQLFQVTQAVGQAIAIQGGLATTSAGAVLQLSQAFGSGRVQLEEFNSVITGLYPIAKAAAEGIDATGGSIARLRRMIADGEVDSRMLFQGILNSLDSLDEQFKQTTPTISQAFTILRNSLVMYVGDLNSASGASESFAKAIIALSKNMDEVVKGAVVLGAALGPAALTRIILGLRTAVLALNVALLANPFGAMATAAAAAITYLLVFNKELDDLAKSIDKNATVVDRLGATWAGVLAYIKKAWETFPEWFGSLMIEAVDKGVEALSKLGTRLFGDLEVDVAQGEKILGFFGIKLPAYIEKAKEGLPQFKEALEDTLNFDLPPGVIDRQKDNGSQAAQAFDDAYEDYLLRARHRREQQGGGGGGGGGGLPPGMPNEKALKNLQKELDRVLDAIDPVEAAWRKFVESADTLDKGLAAGILTLEDYEVALTKLKATMLDDIFPFEAIMRDLLTQRVLLSKEVSERERLARIYEVEKTLKRALTKEELELLDARLRVLQVAEREAQLMDEIQQPTLDYSRNIQALNNLYRDGVISASEFNQKLQELRYQFLQTQTDFGSGVERGLLAIERDFTDTASLIEQAMVRAFGNMEDALTDFFRTGKLDVKRFVDDVLNDLARLYVRQNITAPLAQSLGLMGDSPQKAGGNINLNFGAGSANSLGNALSWVGDKIGSEALSSFAAGMKGSTLAPGLHGPTTQGASGAMGAGNWVGNNFGSILGYGQAIYSLTQGQYGSAAGAAIGTYILPGIGTAVGSFVGGIVDGIFGDREPTTRRGQWEWAEMSGGDWSMKYRDSRQPAGTGDAITQYARSAVDSANSMFGKLGVNAAIEHFYATTNSSLKGDRNGVASGGTIRAGDSVAEFGLMGLGGDRTKYGFGGWSDAEMLPRLQTDIQLSILEAFQTQVDSLPKVLADMIGGVNIRALDAAGANWLVEQFNAIITGVDMLRESAKALPFEQLRDLSFDAAAGLIQLSGGLDGLMGGLNTYYENFYSETERYETAIGNLGKALGGVGVELPKMVGSVDSMKVAYRALVEAQDLNTEAGRQAYAVLIQSSGAFAELATYAGQAAAAVDQAARSLEDIARERASLEMQLLALVGNTAEIRRRELEALDASNRGVQKHIWALEDQAAAAQEAAAQHQRAVAAYQEAVAATNAAWQVVQEVARRDIGRLQETFTVTDSVYRALTKSIDVQRTALNEQVRASESLVAALRGTVDLVRTSVRELRGGVDSTAQMQYQQAMAVIRQAAGGTLPDTDRLAEAIASARDVTEDSDRYASAFERDFAMLSLANELEKVQLNAEPQLTTQEQALEVARQQLTALENTLTEIKTQIDVMRGVDTKLYEQTLELMVIKSNTAQTETLAALEDIMSAAQAQVDALTGGTAAQAQADALRSMFSDITLQIAGISDITDAVERSAAIGSISSLIDKTQLQIDALEGMGVDLEKLDHLQDLLDESKNQLNKLGDIDLNTYVTEKLMADLIKAQKGEEAARAQIEGINAQLTLAQQQYDQLRGINTNTLSMITALGNLAVAMAAEKVATPTTPTPGTAPQLPTTPGAPTTPGLYTTRSATAGLSLAEVRGKRAYKPETMQEWVDYVGYSYSPAKPGAQNLKAEFDRLVSQGVYKNSMAEMERFGKWHYQTYGYNPGRAYAKGGYYPGGMALVGEEGPELINFARPGQVYTANQTQDLLQNLSGGWDDSVMIAIVAEVQALREQVARLVAPAEATARSTSQLADQFDNVSAGGNAIASEVMNKVEVVAA